jgi:hypothetical protein
MTDKDTESAIELMEENISLNNLHAKDEVATAPSAVDSEDLDESETGGHLATGTGQSVIVHAKVLDWDADLPPWVSGEDATNAWPDLIMSVPHSCSLYSHLLTISQSSRRHVQYRFVPVSRCHAREAAAPYHSGWPGLCASVPVSLQAEGSRGERTLGDARGQRDQAVQGGRGTGEWRRCDRDLDRGAWGRHVMTREEAVQYDAFLQHSYMPFGADHCRTACRVSLLLAGHDIKRHSESQSYERSWRCSRLQSFRSHTNR